MSRLSVSLSSNLPTEVQEIIELGNKLQGSFEWFNAKELIFCFNANSLAEQFKKSAILYTQVKAITPVEIKEAISSSQLCDCGWTTRQECDRECEAMIDQMLEVAQEFPTLESLRG